MKLTTGILAVAMMAGGAWAQNPDAIDNARSVAKSLQQKQANDTDAALNAAGVPAKSAKPAPGAPAPAVKPATIPGSKPAPAPVPAKAAVKPASAPASAAKPAAKSATAAKSQTTAAKTAALKPAAAKPAVVAKTSPKTAAPRKPQVKSSAVARNEAAKESAKQSKEQVSPFAGKPEAGDTAKNGDAPKQPKPEDKKWAMSGKRDPFFSPVVQNAGGSGCSTGKKCLEIGQINVRGVVKSDSGFIAVVTNSLNKAYFLRENDPVFNGYVVRITGDSVVFQETVQDKLGKPFTREVVKRLFTPAV